MSVYPVPGTGPAHIPSLHHRSGWHSLLLPLMQPLQNIYSLRCSAGTVKSPALAVFVLIENAKPVTEAAFKAFTLRTKAQTQLKKKDVEGQRLSAGLMEKQNGCKQQRESMPQRNERLSPRFA